MKPTTSSPSWVKTSVRACLVAEFPGAWGIEPGRDGSNALILRSTNLDDDGHINFGTAAKRWIEEPHYTERHLRDGDVLLETSGGGPAKPVGRVAHFQQPDSNTYLCSNFFRTLRPNVRKVNSRFLAWRLLHLYRQPRIWNFQQQTTGIINLKTHDYLEQCFLLPETDEQSRIAAVLDTVDEAIVQTEKVIAKLRQVRTGLLHDLLTCGLDENGQLRDPVAHPEEFQDTPIGRIPKAWEIRTVGQLIAGFESGVSVDSVDTPAAEGEIGVLKTGCITGGVFVPQENKRVKTQDLGRVRCNPKEDCLIISRMNTPQLVGESAYVSLDCEYVYLPDRLWQTIKYPGDPTCIRWLGYVVQEKEFREAVTGGATGTSGSMKNITQSFFLSLPVRVPPRQEQELIAKLAVHHDARITTEQDYRNKLTQLKSGLMDDLLTGRVRIPEGID